MKIFIYKSLFILIGVYILYQLTIGMTVNKYENKLNYLTNDQGREIIRNKLRNELIKANSKDQIFNPNDKKIIKEFILKIQNELNN